LGKYWQTYCSSVNEELGLYYIEIGVQMNEIDARVYEIKNGWNFE
jgi:hypothetical protein